MAIGYTEIDFLNGSAPALNATNLNKMDEAIKDACDQLDAQGTLTEAGRIDANAIAATAGATLAARLQTAANVEDGADVTDEANVTAIAVATDEVTAAPAHWWVLVGGALKRMTQAGWTALVLVATGKTNAATGYTLAGGTTSKTLTVSADADSKDIPTAAGKTAADAIGAASGTGTIQKLSTLISGSTAGYTHLTKLAAAEAETALWDYDTAAKMPPALLREIVEASSGGAATVKVDDLGFPSMMYVVRGPINLGHIHADMGDTSTPHPAFVVNGVAKTEILIGMFLSAQYGSGASARAVSWPGLYPTGSLDFDQSKTLHTAKNGGVAGGWHMMTYWEQALVTWLSMKMNTEPRGNTYYGRAHDSGYEYECGVRSDGLAPGTTSGTAKHRNGSGPDSWSHNLKRWGIHDLVGSMAEWRDGMKIVDGLIRMPNDNNFTLAEKDGETENWPAHGVYFDNTTATSGGAPRLSNERTNALADPNYSSVAHKDMTLTAGFDGLDLVVRQRMLRANLAPKIASSGAAPFAPKGTLYLRNYGERLPRCGGSWYDTSFAGLGYLVLVNPRSGVGSSVGSRAAFISLS